MVLEFQFMVRAMSSPLSLMFHPNLTKFFMHQISSKILFPIKKFTCDNNTSVEFDPFVFIVKDLNMKKVMTRCDSSGELYPFTPANPIKHYPNAVISTTIWHNHLDHHAVSHFNYVTSSFLPSCNKNNSSCNTCSLRKYYLLPFYDSVSITYSPFDIIHTDIWTSPLPNTLDHKYYLVLLDEFSH